MYSISIVFVRLFQEKCHFNQLSINHIYRSNQTIYE